MFYRTIHIHRIHWLINMKRIWLLYGDDYYDLHDCLETVEKKTDYKMWFSGHLSDDMIYYLT